MRIAGIVAWMVLWGWGSLAAQTVVISGQDPGYRGVSLEIFVPAHPFLDAAGHSETVVCNQQGAFRAEVEVETGSIIRIRSGIYDASLYVEPGHQYQVDMPAHRQVSYADQVSPFFEPVRIPLRIHGNPGDINHHIYRFDSLFFQMNELLIYSRKMGNTLPADSLIHVLLSGFESHQSEWFDAYCRYKSGMLILNEGSTGLESISKNYLGPDVLESHPAFMELFGAMFSDFLVFYNRTPEGKGIVHHINRTQNLDSLRAIVASHPAIWNDTLADLVLLQELPSMFYLGGYHKEAILVLLDSLEAHPAAPRYGRYARQLRDKIASLITGHPPPHFSLSGTDGHSYSPADFIGKYTYLMFCTPDHYGCMMEYPFLNSYEVKHKAYLEVVTIMVADGSDLVEEFMHRNNYQWKALYFDGRNGILRDYMIRAFPVAYLIGKDGKLILSPAPLPSEGFEQQLFRIMRSKGEI